MTAPVLTIDDAPDSIREAPPIASAILAAVIDLAMADLPRTPERERFLTHLSTWQLALGGDLDRGRDES